MRIAFCSIDSLSAGLRNFRPSDVVSIYSPRWPVEEIPNVQHWHLRMHDIEHRSANRIAPDYTHAATLFELAHRLPESILIHCTAGLSRSPAAAIGIAVMAGKSAVEVCREVARLAPLAQPNRLLLSWLEEVTDSELVRPAVAAFDYSRGDEEGISGERTAKVMELSPSR